ncbi:MAG TPA: DUF3857 domain-containing protein [Puia sp.]|jgi:hypothetical protein|nr:DUF3857 domain-containing protein [Puia sp.]
MNPAQRRLFLAGACCLLLPALHAQDKMPVRFGKVTPDDFKVSAPATDSAGAVVVADFGTSEFQGNNRGGFDILFRHSRRIRILKRNAFDAATVTIPLYVEGSDMEKIENMKAVTYNLEDGKVVETKLDDKSVFTDKLDKHHIQKKFTFPALKEGSILEYTYTQASPFITELQPWAFQSEYPCLWSEYQVDMPAFFRYVTLSYGFVPFTINTTDERTEKFNLVSPGGADRDQRTTIEDQVVTHRWVMKGVPALKAEPFTTSLYNYLARIEFQLAAVQFTQFNYYKNYMNDWSKLSEELLAAEDFGADLDNSNGWLEEDCKTVTQGANTSLEKAERIFAFVRDKFNCTSGSGLNLSGPIKTVFRNRNGNVADVNLLLTAMLRHEKIKADPVILSTRSHGFTNEVYPLLDRFNYVITRVRIDSSEYYLDASEPWLGFGRLPERCYNGYARVLNKEQPSFVSLDADGMDEKKMTLVILNKDEKGGLSGRLQTTPGFNEACSIRENIKESGEKEFTKKIETSYTGDESASNFEIDSLKRPDDPLQVAYDLRITPDPGSDIFYFNPMMGEAYKENPFKAAERKYPVEMPFAMDETYTMNMEVPDGYVVDELPKSAKVLFNDDEGFFEYLIVKGTDGIQFRSRIKLNKANFKPEDYETLREFFGYIVKKQSEQIVFKKKKA